MPKRLAVKIKSSAEKYVKQGHPWVFSKSIVKLNKRGESGDIAIIFDQETNNVMAIGLYDPDSPMRIKLIHHGGPVEIDKAFFAKKIKKVYKIRTHLLETKTNAYRFLFGENDGFPGLIVDVYNRAGVVKVYSKIWLPYLEMLIPEIVDTANLKSLVLRLSRKLQKEDIPLKEGAILYGDLDNPEIRFKEHGIHFQANVLLGHKTGFFLDHRENRRRIGKMAKAKTVLDVFSYAGGFSVHALAGGAKEVTSLDVSEQALKLAKKNAQLNPHSGKHKTLAGDAFSILNDLNHQGKTYDIVVIDPPSFAKSEKEKTVAKKKYAELAELGVKLTKPKGLLLLASCSSRISDDEFRQVHEETFAQLGIEYDLEDFTYHDVDHPVSFPEGAYLKTGYYRIY